MKKLNLNNLYESPYPPTDTKVLWVDKDKSTGDIRVIHRYNHTTKAWEPYLISVDYLKPDEPSEPKELKTSEVTE